jgi:DNA-directed RNA polymerase sigma subunit (sigma70/sigma32)
VEFHDSTHTDIDNVIHAVARAHAKRFGLSWSQHGLDLIQTGWCGAARASKRYETRGWKFITYAYWFISGDIRRTCTEIAYDRHHVTVLDEAHNLYVNDDPDQREAIRELLKTEDGRQLLAAELGLNLQTDKRARATRQRLKSAVNQLDDRRREWITKDTMKEWLDDDADRAA